jgi:branched-chain amino acid transport system permease protein
VLFFATGTSAGAAVREPGEFIVTLLDGFTLAGLLFVVASGFTLIFGLMRTVNMAHGSLFLLAAYVAIDVQQRMVGKKANIVPDEVGLLDWILPMLAGAAVASIFGLLMFQVFLRWNQGQDLRQALITIAMSVILADQMLARFGGLAQRMIWPGSVTHFFEIFGERYATTRLFMLAISLVVGAALWFWLNRISAAFAVTFLIGSFLAGMGGALGASFAGAAPGTDGSWLLNGLVVVIIGGLGSMKGAAAGSLLFGMVQAFAPAYLPQQYTFYAIIVTFVLLAVVLAIRPNGIFGKATA